MTKENKGKGLTKRWVGCYLNLMGKANTLPHTLNSEVRHMSNNSGELFQDLLTDLYLEGDESNQPVTPDGDDPGGADDSKTNPDDVSDCIEGTNF